MNLKKHVYFKVREKKGRNDSNRMQTTYTFVLLEF